MTESDDQEGGGDDHAITWAKRSGSAWQVGVLPCWRGKGELRKMECKRRQHKQWKQGVWWRAESASWQAPMKKKKRQMTVTQERKANCPLALNYSLPLPRNTTRWPQAAQHLMGSRLLRNSRVRQDQTSSRTKKCGHCWELETRQRDFHAWMPSGCQQDILALFSLILYHCLYCCTYYTVDDYFWNII